MERFLVARNDEEMLMLFVELTKTELSFMALGVSLEVRMLGTCESAVGPGQAEGREHGWVPHRLPAR